MRLRLADVAAEVGIAPATLVQRFGSKRKLLLALAAHAASTVGEQFGTIRAANPSPLAAIRSLADCMACFADTPEALSNGLAFLQMDLSDPDFYRHALVNARAIHREIASLLDEAAEAGELLRCDSARLARAIQSLLNGAMLNWAIHREGTVQQWMRDDLDTLLKPFETGRARAHVSARRSGA